MSIGKSSNWFGVITLFPEMFASLQAGITGRALQNKQILLETINPREFSSDKRVDDKPYGGGPGMVMLADPLIKAIQKAKSIAPTPPHVIYLSPQGKLFNQRAAEELLNYQSIILIAGRYEGIDERVIEAEVDEEWSIGDYVLSGGEIPAMVMIDVLTRFIPGVIGDADSVTQDSHYHGLLKYPQYTRPENYQGAAVPNVLLSGHHQQISAWRKKKALERTLQRRPDLIKEGLLSAEEERLFQAIKNEILQEKLEK